MFKKFLRTLGTYKVQVISMLVMIFLSLSMFVGFSIEWKTVDSLSKRQFKINNFPDYQVYSENGFSIDDITKIKELSSVKDANGYFELECSIPEDDDKNVDIVSLSEYTINTFSLIEGEDYSEDLMGFWINDRYAKENNIKIGDEISLLYSGYTIKNKVLGTIKAASYYICCDFEKGMIMPDFEKYGYAYVSPKFVKSYLGEDIKYSRIQIMSDSSKEEITKEVINKLGVTLLVREKTEDTAYSEAMGEVDEGKLCAFALTIIFFVIAVLSMFTTFDRITKAERIQIGTFKALGFKNRQIAGVYAGIGLFVGVVGTILGILFGYYIGYFFMNPKGSMGTYIDPINWRLSCPGYVWPICILIILSLTSIAYLLVRSTLKEGASMLLKPKAPKKDKPLFIEKYKFWYKLRFITRWNIRDIFRHKIRTFMTMFGILGATMLLFFGFGMKDSINSLLDNYKKAYNFNTMITLSDNATNADALNLQQQYNGDFQAVVQIDIKEKDYVMNIYDASTNKIYLLNKKSKRIEINDGGCYVCYRLYKQGYKVGDYIKVSPYGTSDTYDIKIIGVNRSYSDEGITLSKKTADDLGINYKIKVIYTDSTNIASSEFISATQTKNKVFDSVENMMQVLDEMIILIVIAAIIISIVVLYNLGIMSFIERKREFSTLKVVGFKNKIIGKISIAQNTWLTIISIIISIPISYFTLSLIIGMVGKEYEMRTVAGPITYICSIVITFAVSMLVSLLVIRKNKTISMVEALKESE